MMPRLVKTDTATSARLTREALHEIAVAFAVERFEDKGELISTWIMANDDAGIAWFETPWETDSEKDLHVLLMRKILQSSGVHAYAFITEAWVVKVDGPPGEDFIPPSERPEGERGDDVLLIWTFDRDGNADCTRFLVTIRRQGPNLLGPRVDEDDVCNMEGRMWNLFQ